MLILVIEQFLKKVKTFLRPSRMIVVQKPQLQIRLILLQRPLPHLQQVVPHQLLLHLQQVAVRQHQQLLKRVEHLLRQPLQRLRHVHRHLHLDQLLLLDQLQQVLKHK